MRVIAKAPNKAPIILEMKNTLEEIQATVQGNIETLTLCTDCVIICNRDAFFEGEPANCNICNTQFYGTILVVGAKGDEFTSLKDPEGVAKVLFGECTP